MEAHLCGFGGILVSEVQQIDDASNVVLEVGAFDKWESSAHCRSNVRPRHNPGHALGHARGRPLASRDTHT